MKKVMVLGAYGNFGKIISNALARHKTPLILAGKNIQKLSHLKNQLECKYETTLQISELDVNKNLKQQVHIFRPAVLINTVGPFQNCNYIVMQTAVQQKVNYVDLADSREFIKQAKKFHQLAVSNQVSVICGASTVPGLSSAVIQQFKSEFQSIDELLYGMSPGQKTTRGGIATVKAVLSYIGKPIKTSLASVTYGWQDLYSQKYPQLGQRLMGNCQVPDLDIFPQQYKINKIRFSAGTQSKILHLSIWLTSWLIRLGVPLNLANHAELLSKISHFFDVLGTDNGGMHIILRGKGKNGRLLQRKWFIIVTNGEGPNIPTIPSIVLANKLAKDQFKLPGVNPCSGLVSLKQYLNEMKPYRFKVYTSLQEMK